MSSSSAQHEQSDSPLRIVFITATDLPEGGGHTSRLKSVVNALSKNGHCISILNEHGLGIAPLSVQHPVGTLYGAHYEYVLGRVERRYGFGAFGEKYHALRQIWRRIKTLHCQNGIDLLWFNHLSFYDTYPLTLLARRLGIPTIQAYEDERSELVSNETVSFARRIYAMNSYLADRWCPSLADGIVVISNYLLDKYARLSRNAAKIHLIPTVIDCALWDCGPESVNDIPRIVYSGSFSEQDEFDNLLLALSLLRDRGVSFRFIMLGGSHREGEGLREKRVAAQITKLDLTSMVEQRGFVPLDQVRSELRAANVLMNLRRDGVWARAGLSTKLSEYLASGRAVVASVLGDVGRYLKDGENALLVSPKCDPNEIAAALARALSSPDLRRRIGTKGRQVALKNFDLPVVQVRLRSVMADVLQHHASCAAN